MSKLSKSFMKHFKQQKNDQNKCNLAKCWKYFFSKVNDEYMLPSKQHPNNALQSQNLAKSELQENDWATLLKTDNTLNAFWKEAKSHLAQK